MLFLVLERHYISINNVNFSIILHFAAAVRFVQKY